MALFNVPYVRIAGLIAGVPSKKENYREITYPLSTEYDNHTFIQKTGVEERHIDENLTTSDLCYKAAKQLLSELKWEKEEIGALIFITQFPDFIAPATACILQDKLELPKSCMAFDIELGCSGWVYGLSIISSLMRGGAIKKALLMCGDGRRNYIGADKHAGPLFGHAGTVTALEFNSTVDGFKFDCGTDGSGYESLIIKGGGCRFPFNENSLVEYEENGKKFCELSSKMSGMDVFSFGISVPPKSIRTLLKENKISLEDIDYLVLHQANMQMNDIIVKKLKIPSSKVPESLSKFGNTSSASIPLTMATTLANTLRNGKHNLLCCGFGIGLSWGTVFFQADNIIVPSLVEVDSQEHLI